jgi:hypothetical protein
MQLRTVWILVSCLMLAALGVWRWASQGNSLPPGPLEDAPRRPSISETETEDVAAASVQELSRVVATIADKGNGEPSSPLDAASDLQWTEIPRVQENALGALARMRYEGIVHFRSSYFNPNDTYIDERLRDAFSAAFREALKRVRQLEEMRMTVAQEQIASLKVAGMFEPVASGGSFVWQLKGREHGAPTDGWHTHADRDGRQYQVRWGDLTWTKEIGATAGFMLDQIDVSVVDFFCRAGTLTPADRDVLLIYGIGEGRQRFEQLRTGNREEYLRIRRVLFGN